MIIIRVRQQIGRVAEVEIDLSPDERVHRRAGAAKGHMDRTQPGAFNKQRGDEMGYRADAARRVRVFARAGPYVVHKFLERMNRQLGIDRRIIGPLPDALIGMRSSNV